MARRSTSRSRKAARKSQLRSRWAKRTRKGGKYSWLGAVVRKKPGKRKHVKGHAWTGRKGSVSLFDRMTGKLWGTNPRRGHRRNPSLVGTAKSFVVAPVMALPKSLPALFKGSLVMNGAFAAGGALTALAGGTALQQVVMNLLNRVAPTAMATAMSKGYVQRVVGASFALVAGGLVGRFAIKGQSSRASFITGTAAAALAEALFPGRVASYAHQLPIIGQYINVPASPVQGLMGMYGSDMLAAYVSSPAYQGVGAYVSSPAYQGVGAYVEAPAYQGVGAYVSSPAYQGVGHLGASMDDAVAGMGSDDQLALGAMGSNMPSHLDA